MTNIVIFLDRGRKYTLLDLCSVISSAVLLTIISKEIGSTWKSKCSRCKDLLSLIYLPSQAHWTWGHRTKSTAYCLLMIVLKNHLFRKIIVKKLQRHKLFWTNHPLWWQNLFYSLKLGLGDIPILASSWLVWSTLQGAVRVWAPALCSVVGEDTPPSHCLSPPRCLNGYQQI